MQLLYPYPLGQIPTIIRKRAQYCINTGGGHFELLLQELLDCFLFGATMNLK
jgi:hypothetical protein